MFNFAKGVAIAVPIMLLESDGTPVTGAVAGDLTVRISNKNSTTLATLTPTTEYTLQELSGGEGGAYFLTLNLSVNDTFGTLLVEVVEASSLTKYYTPDITQIGTPISVDGGDDTLVGMIKKIFDDNGGVDFVSATDSLKQIAQTVGNITNTGSANNQHANLNSEVDIGIDISGDYTTTIPLDQVRWEASDDSGNFRQLFVFDITEIGSPSGMEWIGYLQGNNDALVVNAYDWIEGSWIQIGAIVGKVQPNDETVPFTLFNSMVGSGGDAGKVLVEFVGTGLTSSLFATDRILLQYNTSQSAVGYANGAVWIDTLNGFPGSVSGVNGVADHKSNNLADALTIGAQKGLNSFIVSQGSSLTFTQTMSNVEFHGIDFSVEFNEQIMDSVVIEGANLSGIALAGAGSLLILESQFFAPVTLPPCATVHCAIGTRVTLSETGVYVFEDPFGVKAAQETPCLIFASDDPGISVNFRHADTGIELEGMRTGDKMSIGGDGQYILNANCVGGDLSVRGNWQDTDNSGNVTIVQVANTPVALAEDIAALEVIATLTRKILTNRFNVNLTTSQAELSNDADTAVELVRDLKDDAGNPITVNTVGPIAAAPWSAV
ncbi:MAG: hypothetical protein JRC86_10225 [Deltaproteobacteria bacterium]|nr:hypothetical protein [Deltaproteobacteria bacterium]